MTRHQRGFSLPELLFSLTLFAVVSMLFMNYLRGLQQGSEVQWQTHQLWRYALEQTEPEAPVLPDGWTLKKQQMSCGVCLCVRVKIISPYGRSGQLSKQICPPSKYH